MVGVVVLGVLAAKSGLGPAPEAVCGRVYSRPPDVQPESIGPLRLQASISDLRRSCPGARDTSFYLTAGFYIRAFGSRIDVLGDLLSQALDEQGDRLVNVIVVSGGNRVRTPEGIGPGSTLRDAKRAWGELQVIGCSAGARQALVPRRPGLIVDLGDVDCTKDHLRVISTYSDSVSIEAIEISVVED